MHIHALTLNPVTPSAQSLQSAAAARLASETRKKLFSVATDLDTSSSVTDPWAISMVGAFADSSQGRTNQNFYADAETGQDRFSDRSEEAMRKVASAGPVSFWA